MIVVAVVHPKQSGFEQVREPAQGGVQGGELAIVLVGVFAGVEAAALAVFAVATALGHAEADERSTTVAVFGGGGGATGALFGEGGPFHFAKEFTADVLEGFRFGRGGDPYGVRGLLLLQTDGPFTQRAPFVVEVLVVEHADVTGADPRAVLVQDATGIELEEFVPDVVGAVMEGDRAGGRGEHVDFKLVGTDRVVPPGRCRPVYGIVQPLALDAVVVDPRVTMADRRRVLDHHRIGHYRQPVLGQPFLDLVVLAKSTAVVHQVIRCHWTEGVRVFDGATEAEVGVEEDTEGGGRREWRVCGRDVGRGELGLVEDRGGGCGREGQRQGRGFGVGGRGVGGDDDGWAW